MKRVLGKVLLFAIPLSTVLMILLAWIGAGGIPSVRDMETGDRIRDLVIQEFDESIFRRGRSPILFMWSKPVGIEIRDHIGTSPLHYHALVKELEHLTKGRVFAAGSGSGDIIIDVALSANLPDYKPNFQVHEDRFDGAPCLVRREVWLGQIMGARVAVFPELNPSAAGRCFASELLYSLGVTNLLGPIDFSRGEASGHLLSTRQRLVLELLFFSRLSPGQKRGEVLSIVRKQVTTIPRDALCAPPDGYC